MEDSKFVTVSVLNNYIARFFDANPYLDVVYLKGEISNFKWSGRHCYFSIKDEVSEISAMMFYPDNQALDFVPMDGMQIQVRGKVQVYPKKGTYAIIVKKISKDGIGILYQEFIELKEKLQKEGLFDDIYKKPLPKYPKVVAVITSPTGDAIHDIISTFNRRLPMAKIILYPALVQGRDAAADLVRALKQVYSDNLADVLIIGRGGGSFEDLSCFNDETLARTLFASPIPTVTGIGHEADYTICDFVSSYRAPTPTGAAMRLTREKKDCYEELSNQMNRLKKSIISVLRESFNEYQKLINSYGLLHFDKIVDRKIDSYNLLKTKLEKHSPINQLEIKINYVKSLTDSLATNFLGDIKSFETRLELNNNVLKPALINQKIEQCEKTLNEVTKRLVLLNPFNTMGRGYAIVSQNGIIANKISDINFDDLINIKMVDGSIDAKVISESYELNEKEED